MRLVFLGAPGAGKGTQAEGICRRYNISHISTGEIFRENISKGTELGKRVQEYLKSGKLVPDDVVTNIVTDKLAKPECVNGFLLDGFPRTITQAESLDVFLSGRDQKLDYVLYIEVSESVVIERLSNRRHCGKCGKLYNLITNPPKDGKTCDDCGSGLIQREDDLPQTIKKRIMVYENLTQPLISYYRSMGMLKSANGDQAIDKLTQDIFDILDGTEK